MKLNPMLTTICKINPGDKHTSISIPNPDKQGEYLWITVFGPTSDYIQNNGCSGSTVFFDGINVVLSTSNDGKIRVSITAQKATLLNN